MKMHGTRAGLSLSALLLCVAHVRAVRVADEPEIDFEGLGRAFLEACCGKGATQQDWPVQRVLDERFAAARLGAFDVRYPASSLDGKNAASDFAKLAAALVQLQHHWIGWQTAGTDAGAGAQADVETLRRWVVAWDTKKLARLAAKPEQLDLVKYLEMPTEVAAAEERLWSFLHDAKRVGLPMMAGKSAQIALSPTRLDFMQWVGYAGLVEPEQRQAFWVPGIDQWTQIWSGWTMITALEYAPWTGYDPEFRTGKSMNSIDPTGMVEQICLQAGMSLLRHCVNRDLDHHDNSIAMNLVIEMVGQLNTIDGEAQVRSSGGKTQPYSRFIPGGLSSGGTLPPRSAQALDGLVQNPWRKSKGADHFVRALREGQKDGAKAAFKDKHPRWKDKSAHFLLRTDAEQWVVSAPFFGPHAKDQAYPPSAGLVADYSELFRAYKSAFHWWLRDHGDPASEEASRVKYREFMSTLDEVDHETRTIDALFERVYGVPLSSADGETDTLEWRFLAFLSKART